jgi:hypothetical protein
MGDYMVTVSYWDQKGPTGKSRKIRVHALSKDDAERKGRCEAILEDPTLDPIVTKVQYVENRKG